MCVFVYFFIETKEKVNCTSKGSQQQHSKYEEKKFDRDDDDEDKINIKVYPASQQSATKQ